MIKKNGDKRVLGDGEITHIWRNPWVRGLPNYQVFSIPSKGEKNQQKVKKLWEGREWNQKF